MKHKKNRCFQVIVIIKPEKMQEWSKFGLVVELWTLLPLLLIQWDKAPEHTVYAIFAWFFTGVFETLNGRRHDSEPCHERARRPHFTSRLTTVLKK
jgi:hypothetical protein